MARTAFADAEKLFRQALAIAPGEPRVIRHLADCLMAQHRLGEAEAHLHAALAVPGLDASLRAQLEQQLGLALKQQRKYPQALAHMQAAASRMPPGREAAIEQANVLRHLGRTDEAARAVEALLGNYPNFAVERHLRNFYWKLPEDLAHYREGLLKAGVPFGKIELVAKRAADY